MPPAPSEGTRYRVQVVCNESQCKLEDGIIMARSPAEAEAELRTRMAAYAHVPVRGVLIRSDNLAAPWLVLGDPPEDAIGLPPC